MLIDAPLSTERHRLGMEVSVRHRLDEARARLQLELQTGRNDGWTETMIQVRLERLERAVARLGARNATKAAA